MATFVGTVHKSDLEGGIWELHAADGERYQLRSSDKKLLVDGQKVQIQGTIDKEAFGIGMTGPYLAVSSWNKG